MIHEMKLQPEYYNFILNGTKRIEIRLFDESFNAKVVGLLRYNSFEDMFKDFDISVLSDKSMTKDELIDVLEEFYTKEKQTKYGVLGIRIELM